MMAQIFDEIVGQPSPPTRAHGDNGCGSRSITEPGPSKLTFEENEDLIAVVDDDGGVRASLGDFLRSLGHSVALFSSAEALLASPALGEARCAICDLNLGEGMDGLELVRVAGRHRADLPFILIPALAGESLRATAMAAGVRAVVDKPFDMDALAVALAAALAGPCS